MKTQSGYANGPIYWTIENAAAAIQKQEDWHDGPGRTLFEQMLEAAQAGELPIYHPDTEVQASPRHLLGFADLVTSTEVNAWLRRKGSTIQWNTGCQSAVPTRADSVPAPGGTDRPRFIIPVWPKEVPPELLALPPETEVVRADGPRPGIKGEGVGSAWQVVEWFKAIIARQAKGRFSLAEAAAIFANAEGGDPNRLLDEIKGAAIAGTLPVHWSGRDLTHKGLENSTVLCDEVFLEAFWGDLNAWLDIHHKQTTFRFPMPVEQASITGRIHTTRRRASALGAVITKAQLNALDASEWTSAWAALVAMASSDAKPAPLLGYTEGEGVKYQTDSDTEPVAYLSREAFRKRVARSSKPASGH